MQKLLSDISNCTICKEHLPLGPRPVVQISKKSRVLIIGQAPGTKVHASGKPFDDQSGKRLRQWMGIDDQVFYDPDQIAIMPMGFCYPGRGKSGDLPPRKECAPQWHQLLLNQMPDLKLTLLIGQYALAHYIGDTKKKTLTETVRSYHEYLPNYFPIVHPSPRNQIWMKKNEWFETDVVPELQSRIKSILDFS